MPIYFQEDITFRDPADAENLVRHAFAGTSLEAIYDGDDDTKEVWIWNDWHTSRDSNQHLTVKVFEDNDGHWMTTFYHVYRNGSYRFMGEESPSSYAYRLERYNTTNWGGE
ncbi:hypothetical protein BJX70DRAFT_397024 [Aspergillus crustosus]